MYGQPTIGPSQYCEEGYEERLCSKCSEGYFEVCWFFEVKRK